MSRLLKIGNAIFSVIMLFWVYSTLMFFFQYLNFDLTNLNTGSATILIFLTVSFLAVFLFRSSFHKLFKRIFTYLLAKKWIVLAGLVSFQLFIIFTSLRLASADTTIVYNLAVDPNFAAQSDYIAIYPNNFLFLIWYKLNHLIFKDSMLFALAVWNIVFIDLAIWITYRTTKKLGSQLWADIQFVLMVLIIGCSPQYIYTYSDPVALFLVSCLIASISQSLQKNNWISSIVSGFLVAIAYGVRPPVMIFIIAGLIVLLYKFFETKKIKKITIKSLIFIAIGFTIFNTSSNILLKNQSFVRYEPDYSRTLLHYVNLGLTYSGNQHSDISPEAMSATGENRNKEALKEINMRLDNYQYNSFVGHLFFKFYWITNEGMFGWLQEQVLSEESPIIVPWLEKIQQTNLASKVRQFIYVSGSSYSHYARILQIIWIIIIFGLAVYSWKYFSLNNNYLLWMQITIFGGLLFLMIFEGGRTRYLIQFLPAITSVSSAGLMKYFSRKS
ncbi:TPA: hypothetical protein U2B88_002035 [Streptococcus suis]|uniref:hypothetical protein n=1 Tax=Streptococcus suis TaxID=1307 RepID=UPI000CF5E719|nr:hypothetical protein [Streptococcus suis]MCK3881887.1 hypothetical protein [Streptococcus suis]HEM5989395.1 hypothetical protein [Streptococcus suis]HEM6089966.1 hypothetical protein [Streptococcus suis]